MQLLISSFYTVSSEENITVPAEWGEYGKDWVMFPGDNDTLHYVNLSDTTPFEPNLRTLNLVNFFLYTR